MKIEKETVKRDKHSSQEEGYLKKRGGKRINKLP